MKERMWFNVRDLESHQSSAIRHPDSTNVTEVQYIRTHMHRGTMVTHRLQGSWVSPQKSSALAHAYINKGLCSSQQVVKWQYEKSMQGTPRAIQCSHTTWQFIREKIIIRSMCWYTQGREKKSPYKVCGSHSCVRVFSNNTQQCINMDNHFAFNLNPNMKQMHDLCGNSAMCIQAYCLHHTCTHLSPVWRTGWI